MSDQTDARQRLTTNRYPAIGVNFFTPDQDWFRERVQGRWSADRETGAHAPVNMIRYDPDTGCCDTIKLEPAGTEYLDLGGRGAVDMAARQG